MECLLPLSHNFFISEVGTMAASIMECLGVVLEQIFLLENVRDLVLVILGSFGQLGELVGGREQSWW